MTHSRSKIVAQKRVEEDEINYVLQFHGRPVKEKSQIENGAEI